MTELVEQLYNQSLNLTPGNSVKHIEGTKLFKIDYSMVKDTPDFSVYVANREPEWKMAFCQSYFIRPFTAPETDEAMLKGLITAGLVAMEQA